MRDKRYLSTVLAVYLFYFMHGMAVIMISQHKPFFLEHWSNETGAGVAYAISAIGLGKLLTQYLGGWLADRSGRRPSLIIAMLMYAAFFFGLAFAPSWIVASLLGFLFGCANSVVDGGAYPTLMEVFPRVAGSANVAVKAFIAGGQYLLPVIIGMIITRSLQWNIALLVAAAIILALFVLMLLVPFPDYKAIAAEEAAELERLAAENAASSTTDEPASAPVSKLAVEGVAIIARGFTTLGSFWLAQNALPDFGKSLAGMSDVAAAGLTSTYALGSLISVFVTAVLVAKAIKAVYFLVIGPLGTVLGHLGLAFFSTSGAFQVSAFLIGFFASGGLLQLLINVMAEFFPGGKGKTTGMVFTASSLASFLLPLLSGILNQNILAVVWMGTGVTVLGLILGILVNIRHTAVFRGAAASAR